MEKEKEKEKQTAFMDNWYHDGDVIIGEVRGHAVIPNRTIVRTSKVVKMDRRQNVAETLSTIYHLGNEINKPKTN